MRITRNWRFFIDYKTGSRDEVQLANTTKGFKRLDQWLAAWQAGPSKSVLVSEHTGRYGEQLLRWTTNTEWSHAVVKTTALQKVGSNIIAKPMDAQQLAEYGRRFEDKLQPVEAPNRL